MTLGIGTLAVWSLPLLFLVACHGGTGSEGEAQHPNGPSHGAAASAGASDRRDAGGSAAADTTPTGAEPYHGMIAYRAKDAKPALVRPRFVEADQAGLADGVSVVGVVAGGQSRAYPLYVLKNHQVVNDKLGDVPIAASW